MGGGAKSTLQVSWIGVEVKKQIWNLKPESKIDCQPRNNM